MSQLESPRGLVPKVIAVMTVSVFAGLGLIMLHGNGQLLNSQVKVWGEKIWSGYNTMFTMGDVTCDLDQLEKNHGVAVAALNGKPEPKGSASDDVDALFEESPPSTEKTTGEKAEKDAVDDLFDDDQPTANEQAKSAAQDDVDALFDESTPSENAASAKLDGSNDDVDALFDDESTVKGPSLAAKNRVLAAKAAVDNCRSKHAAFAEKQKLITSGVKRYRGLHQWLEGFVVTGTNYYKHFLVVILLLCAVVTTLKHHHIALRPVSGRHGQRIASGAQLVVHSMLFYSFWRYGEIQVGTVDGVLAQYWLIGLGALIGINFYHLLTANRQSQDELNAGTLLTIPLYCMMALLSGSYFLLVKDYPSGLAAKLGLITVNAKLYLQVGLYVWVGMLLKQSLVTRRVFDVLRPFKLAPELLAVIVVIGAAVPTAYSGASGIFVIAAGAIIYDELRAVGARQSLALASTAMSGSLGVVLSPCLLVVIVASLDNSVTTDELFKWGTRVFLLTALLFTVMVLTTRQNKLSIKWDDEAKSGAFSALRALVPYFAAFVIGLGFCYFALGAKLDELWAPYLLPLFMFGFLFYERGRSVPQKDEQAEQVSGGTTVIGRIRYATQESSLHIGALLLLMGMSVTLGAMVEAAELMEAVSVDFSNVWLTMGVLVVVLVVVGMTMDPYGAVILVAATIAGVAKQAGIEMLHFWMVVLVAFELGYLTPPVALNHLLTRQVVGDVEIEAHQNRTFYMRNERYMLPISVLGIALVAVAFLPLCFY